MKAFFPQPIYGQPGVGGQVPRVLAAPPKYIQGPGVLQHIGRYLSVVHAQRVGILASARGHGAQAGLVGKILGDAGVASVHAVFAGECSLAEIERHSSQLQHEQLDVLLAVGGGKCVDAAKCIAHRLSVPLIVVPTLASNDAPCSAVSVLYTPEGVAAGAEFFPENPIMVIVDTAEIAAAPARYLVAGMGDAMATWYEARVCMQNPQARNVLGARPTLTACAMGELCAQTLYREGSNALQALSNGNDVAVIGSGRIQDALEDVVEANTLLSGVGFESGGLAAAHGYAQGYTTVPDVEGNYLHGEMVAMGVVAQLMLEDDVQEAERATRFFAEVGLPIHLKKLGLNASQETLLNSVIEGTLTFAPLENLPFQVDADMLKSAVLRGDALGMQIAGEVGDAAYRRLQGLTE